MTVAAGDAHPEPLYNCRFRLTVPTLDADGDPTTPTSPDTELSQDGGTFADATNEWTELATSSGSGYIDLIGTELDTTCTAVQVKSSNCKTTVAVLNPRRLPVIRSGTAQAGGNNTITLDASASAVDDFYNGCYVRCSNDTPSNVLGQARKIVDYDGSTKVATVAANWGTNPSSSTTFEILYHPDAPLWDPIRGIGAPTALPNTACTTNASLITSGTGTAQLSVSSGKALLQDNAVTAAVIATGAIDADAIADDAIDAGAIASNAITAAKIASDAITAAKIADGAIDAATFATGAITAAAIADDAIDAGAIASDAITEIQAGLATSAALATVAGYIDTEVASILSILGSNGDTLIDRLIGRNVSNCEAAAASTSLAAVILIATKSAINQAIPQLEVLKTTGASFHDYPLTTEAAAEAITGISPS